MNIIPTPILEQRTFAGDTEPSYVVTFDWSAAGVDRPNTGGISTGPGPRGRKLAERLMAATRAGKVFSEPTIVTDINGKTFISARESVMGRYLNADLRRLGF